MKSFLCILLLVLCCKYGSAFAPVQSRQIHRRTSPIAFQPPTTLRTPSQNNQQQRLSSPSLSSPTQLQMVNTPVIAISAITALMGGFFAGGLHAISGESRVCPSVHGRFNTSRTAQSRTNPEGYDFNPIAHPICWFWLQVPIIWRPCCLDVLVSGGTSLAEWVLCGEWGTVSRQPSWVPWPISSRAGWPA